ncbi:MAG: hypothetical protein SGJ05_03450 [bacterium]|nr:hypothetical protein [bacterium]
MKPLIILALVVTAAHFWFATVDWQGKHANIDLKHYRVMAAEAPGISMAEEAPFCYRILPTWLSGIAGKGLGNEGLGFAVVSALCVLFAGVVLYWYLVGKGISELSALTMGTLAIISQHVLGGVVFNPFQTCDALAIALMLVMLTAIERNRIWVFVLASILGALTREPCLIMLPVAFSYVIWKEWSRDRTVVWKWTAACIPAVLAAMAVRMGVPASNAEWSLAAMLVENAYKFTNAETWIRLGLFAAAPISLIPFYFFRQTSTVLRSNPHLMVLVVLVVASSFLGADTERLVAPAMVVFYLITARVLDIGKSGSVNIFIVAAGLICTLNPLFVHWSPFTYVGDSVTTTYAYYCSTALVILLVTIVVALSTRRALSALREHDAKQRINY